MADSGFLSDTDESAVEELISQAKDLSVLEQVAAINCSGFTDSVLPTQLEQRFRKLKSFPASSNSQTLDKSLLHRSKSELKNPEKSNELEQTPTADIGLENYMAENEADSDIIKKKDERRLNSMEKFKDNGSSPILVSSSSGSPNIEESILSGRKPSKLKSKPSLKSFTSPLSSPESWMDPPSPPKRIGCFMCSPKSAFKKKTMKGEVVSNGCDWDKNNDFLSDLSASSLKKQRKLLAKAMKEEEKLSREAEKMVKLVKQASIRLSAHHHDIEDELMDD